MDLLNRSNQIADHLSRTKAQAIKIETGYTLVSEVQRLTEERICRIRGIGKRTAKYLLLLRPDIEMPAQMQAIINDNSMTSTEKLKAWNSSLYYSMLDWKDRNPGKFITITNAGSKSDSLGGCTPAELSAIIVLLINDITAAK